MKRHPHVLSSVRRELNDWRPWATRALVLAFAALAGLTVVLVTWMSDIALGWFNLIEGEAWWAPLLWTPACTAAVVWLTLRFAPGAAGSGIPQVMAALTPGVSPQARGLFVSIRLSAFKLVLTAWGLLGGLSLGREGPSVQVAAGVMHSVRRWLPANSAVSDNGLLIAGGAAGIAAAFNTPLGGIMFAIEELSRSVEQRSNGLVMAAIVLGGLMSVSIYGNATHFGVIHVQSLTMTLLLPGLVVALSCGLAGGLFARLLVVSLSGRSRDWFTRMRKQYPVRFAAACGLGVAVIGIVSLGATFGSGNLHTRSLLANPENSSSFYVLLKFIATWLTTWAGVPAGIFAPSLSIGGALGNDIAQFFAQAQPQTLIALGMVGFLAAVTQAPLTSFIIVMEMIDGHAMVLSLMACALVASGVSRLVSVPLYPALAEQHLQRIPPEPTPSSA